MQQPPNGPDMSKDGILAATKEAEHAPTEFEPRERAKYVKERVEEARRLKALGQSDEQIKQAMGDFVVKYPTLFQMAMSSNFSQQKLTMMLSLLDRMASGMTQHQASVVVGQQLANAYIKPVVDRTPPDKYPGSK
jgi:hypothetical protein